MAIDTSIYGQIKQPENPLNSLAQIAQLQHAQNQNRLADLTFSEKEREVNRANTLDDIFKGAIGPDGQINQNKLFSGMSQGGLGSKIPSVQKTLLETDKARAEMNKHQVELVDAKLKQSKSFLESVRTPEQYIAWHEANHTDPILGPALAARGVTAEQARASITAALQQPGGFEDLLRKSALGIEKFTEMNKPLIQTRNTGGTTDTLAINPFTGEVKVTGSVRNTQSPDSVASVGATIRGQNLTNARAQEQIAAGKVPAGYRANPDGSLTYIPGGPADPNVKSAGPATEDERKAAGWYAQADNAWKNMQSVMYGKQPGKDGKPPLKDDVVKPGYLENSAQAFGLDQTAQRLRSADRQKFLQGSSSLNEALLRAATGAGMNAYEAKQKADEMTPQLNDKPELIQQKMDSIPVYLESLRSRAGRAAPKAPAGGPKTSSGEVKFLGFE